MAHFKKYIPYILAFSGIIILYLTTRLYGLLDLPIFTDEAIYIRWAQIANADAAWRFISLTDGKQPLFIWFMMGAMRVFEDPLFAGRVVSVASGLATLIGLFFLGREVFKNVKVGILSAAVYAAYPFALVYDRMALYDSMVATFFVWSIYFSVLLARKIRLDIAMILGLITGLATLNKSSGFFGVYLLPFSLLLIRIDKKGRVYRFLKWGIFAFVAVFFTYAMYSILRLSPFFYLIDEKNTTFLYTTQEIIEAPLRSFRGNLIGGQLTWLLQYMTVSGVVLTILGVFIDKKFIREKVYLLILFVLPMIGLAVFGRLIYPRYILFMTMPLIPLIAYALVQLVNKMKKKVYVVILLGFAALFPAYSMYMILTDFAKAPIPLSDVAQYKTGWPSGEGIQESIEYINELHVGEDVYLATQGTFGLMPFAYEIYFHDNPNVTVEGFWPIENEIPQKLIDKSEQMPTYIAFYQPCHTCEMGQAPQSWPVSEVMEVKKGEGEIAFRLYRVNNK